MRWQIDFLGRTGKQIHRYLTRRLHVAEQMATGQDQCFVPMRIDDRPGPVSHRVGFFDTNPHGRSGRAGNGLVGRQPGIVGPSPRGGNVPTGRRRVDQRLGDCSQAG